jgi:hypothetical protein
VDHLIHRPRTRVEGGVHGDRLTHGEIPVDTGGLQHDPDAALQPGPLTAGIHTKNADLTAVPGPVALENLDRGGLARPVRAEQREHLAYADRQVDAPDSLHARVRLHQATNIQRERARMADLNRAEVIKFTHVLYRHDARSPAHQPVGRTGPLTQGGERPVTRRRCDGWTASRRVAPTATARPLPTASLLTLVQKQRPARRNTGMAAVRADHPGDDPSRRSGADLSVQESCEYRPEQPMNVPVMAPSSTEDPPPTGSRRTSAIDTAAPSRGAGRMEQTGSGSAALGVCAAVRARAGIGRLNQPFPGDRRRAADSRLRRICVTPADTANSAAPYGPAT